MTDHAVMRAYTEATVKLLLGNRKVKPSLAFTAGNVLSIESRVSLARGAVESDTDLIHLAFTTNMAGDTVLADITIFCPRDGACHIHTGGRLAQKRGSKRAVILPPDNIRGYFEVVSDEIIQRPSKTRDLLEGGVKRAEVTLRRIICAGANVTGQLSVIELRAAV